MELEENKLRDLLSGEAEKERRAYKRATLLIAIPALVGLFWLGFSVYNVVELNKEIQGKKIELEDLSRKVKEVRESLSEAERALENIATRPESSKSQAERALATLPISLESPFLMAIEDVFTIQGRGTVVTGRVERGKVKLNDPVEIVGIRPTQQAVVTGVEMFRKVLDEAEAGDNVGLLLRGVERRDIERGQVIAKPGSISPHTKFKAKVDMLEQEKGGRHTPFPTDYRPQFYFRTTDVTGMVKFPSRTEMVMPGDKDIEVEVELIVPIALEKGLKFAIREGGRTVGTGIITGIIE